MREMISLEEARELILSRVEPLDEEIVPTLEALGRVAASPLISDIDVSPFAHAAMDGFAIKAASLAQASAENPVEMDVVAEVAAGDVFDKSIQEGQCVRIMTGAPLPAYADAVVKYEIVGVMANEGKAGGRVSFSASTHPGSNVRPAGEEAKAGEVVVQPGEVVSTAGVGFLAGCGIVDMPVYRHPTIAVIAIGSELVDPSKKPSRGKIRNSNSSALAACAISTGAIPTILPIVEDSEEELAATILKAVKHFDFVVTSGGASNGDFDFIKPVVEQLGDLLMTSVNMRPGKAQTFGMVEGTPVFGLPGNPAAAFVGFEMLIRPALKKMQGYRHLDRPRVKARLACDVKKKDPRRIFLRSTLCKNDRDDYVVTPAKNQSSGLFSVIQRSNCMVILPEGGAGRTAGSVVDCLILDVSEELSL